MNMGQEVAGVTHLCGNLSCFQHAPYCTALESCGLMCVNHPEATWSQVEPTIITYHSWPGQSKHMPCSEIRNIIKSDHGGQAGVW